MDAKRLDELERHARDNTYVEGDIALTLIATIRALEADKAGEAERIARAVADAVCQERWACAFEAEYYSKASATARSIRDAIRARGTP